MKGVCAWEDANDGVLSASRPERGLPAHQSDGTAARERACDRAYGQNVPASSKRENVLRIFIKNKRSRAWLLACTCTC